jgi:protein-disulfide isomerase
LDAAHAAVAASYQGRFWPFAKALFDHQAALEASDIDRYAREVGLDVKRLRADMQSKKTADIVARDMKEADDLGLQGTPFILVNGRELGLDAIGSDTKGDIVDWLSLDLDANGAPPSGGTR